MMKHRVDETTAEVAAQGKEVLLRCNSREIAKCPPCAALYRGDARAIIYEGLRTALENGEQVAFLTLTAPSFGKTHFVPPLPPPRLNARQKAAWEKRYRRPCPCKKPHAPGDRHFKGLPLSLRDYDYEGQVQWNAEAGCLWSRTADEITRILGLGERLAYIGTAEWQTRGAIHLHMILRIPTAINLEIEDGSSHLIERAVAASATFAGPHRTGRRIAWGPQVRAEMVTTERHAFRTAGYLAKLVGYAIKDLSVNDNHTATITPIGHHLQKLTEAAERTPCGSPGEERHRLCHYRTTGYSQGLPIENARRERCGSLRHRQWGWRGHVIRRSRNWAALTMTECRRRRTEWGRLQREAENPVISEDLSVWLRPADGLPMQVEENAWPRLRDGRLKEVKALLR